MMSVFIIYDVKKVVGIQNFQIPTTSSNPTILAGDRIIADIEAYKNNDPDYGDLVVFKKPDEQCYVFRIVGLPNDKIEIIDNIVSVNGKISKSNFIAESIDFGMKINELEEELPNGHKHLIYKFKTTYDTSKANIKNIIGPPNSYYVLGDYRDNAVDSRFDGFVPKDKIIGRVIYCYWRKIGPKKTNIDLRDK
jgi:signal peptidase I